MALLEAVGDIDCLPDLDDASFPFLDDGDKPLAWDACRSGREVRRLGGASLEKPSRFACHPRNFGEAELPRFAFTGEIPLLPLDDAGPLEPMLALRRVGVEDRGGGVDGLLGGVEGLREGVADGKTGGGLERGAEDGLPLTCPKLLLDRGDGLKRCGLALLLLVL